MTENHFFSLSCLLYPHVRATPDYRENPYFDRAWPQNLYLDPSSPLLDQIQFPKGFDVAMTPLVTFRRVDLLMEPSQLDALYHSLHPNSKHVRQNESIFSDEGVWNIAPSEYVKIFTAPLPQGNYGTLIISTGGHWTTTLFAGLKDTNMYKDGIQNVLDFFGESMAAWAKEVQHLLNKADAVDRQRSRSMAEDGLETTPKAPRQVVVRAYLPGHEDCHDHREPWTTYQRGPNGWYNWHQIGDFNRVFEVRYNPKLVVSVEWDANLLQAIINSRRYPDIHFLPIDRPALLRPDAHSAGDCLHIMTGSGVMEGWTHYIWHYVTVELPGRLR